MNGYRSRTAPSSCSRRPTPTSEDVTSSDHASARHVTGPGPDIGHEWTPARLPGSCYGRGPCPRSGRPAGPLSVFREDGLQQLDVPRLRARPRRLRQLPRRHLAERRLPRPRSRTWHVVVRGSTHGSAGAGQLVLVDGHDLSEDVTSFDHDFSKTLKARTAIGHEWRRRVSQGLKDRSWSMSAFWEAGRAALVFREDGLQQLMSRAYGLAPGAYTHSFRGAISPKSATETPVEDLVMWSSEGNVNAAGVAGGASPSRRVRSPDHRQQQLLHHQPGRHRGGRQPAHRPAHLPPAGGCAQFGYRPLRRVVTLGRVVAREFHPAARQPAEQERPGGHHRRHLHGRTVALHRHPRGCERHGHVQRRRHRGIGVEPPWSTRTAS